MLKIVSIPLFQVGLLFIATTIIWFLVTDEENPLKKKVFDFITDALYYLIITSLGVNVFLNFSDVLSEPYQAIIISSEASWLAFILVSSYLLYREKKKDRNFTITTQNYIDQTVNYLLILALANHLFYYYKYQSLQSVIFIVIYFLSYLLKDKITDLRRNEILLTVLALAHGVMMYLFSNIIIYYQIVFYPYQIISLLIIASLFILYYRRDLSSEQK